MHLPAAALPGSASLYSDPAGQAVAAQVFGRHPGWAGSALYSGRAAVPGQLTVGPGTFSVRAAEFNGSGDTRLVVRDAASGKAVNLTMSTTAAGGTGYAGIGIEGVAAYININTANGRVGLLNQTTGTGSAAAALTANKPGTSTAVATWLTISINGTDYVIPAWLPT